MNKLTIYEVARHRNGVAGEGFYAIRFYDHELLRSFVATVFGYIPECDRYGGERFWNEVYADPHVAVLDVDLLPHTVEFGKNSWRGDRYADEMYRAIDAYEERRCVEAEADLRRRVVAFLS